MTKDNDAGGEFGSPPNDKYAKFLAKFPEIETLEVNKWKPVHLLAYFCKKYKQAYHVPYQLKFNSPKPADCFEMFRLKSIGLKLSSNPTVLKNYLDWAFKIKVENSKRRITSISFIVDDTLLNDYKFNVLLGNKQDLQVDRSTQLSDEIKEIMKALGPINTYGDLSFCWQAHKSSGLGELAITAFANLQASGFDLAVLEKIV